MPNCKAMWGYLFLYVIDEKGDPVFATKSPYGMIVMFVCIIASNLLILFLNYDTICFEYQFERVLVFRFKVLSFTIIYQKSINLKTREY